MDTEVEPASEPAPASPSPSAPATEATPNYVSLVADIVSAYVSNNSVPPADLPALIASINAAISGLDAPSKVEETAPQAVGAVSIKKSLASSEYIISMIDGKPYSTLKRHISNAGYDEESYKTAFGLPSNYPMTAPAYSARRSALAKEIGLGNSKSGDAAPKPVKLVPKASGKGRGRPRKDAA